MWPLALKETGAFIGYSGFLKRQYGEYKGEIEIGYALSRDVWGRGLAAEAGGEDSRVRVRCSRLRPSHRQRKAGERAVHPGDGENGDAFNWALAQRQGKARSSLRHQ